jgi:hypothetical protein
LTIFSPSWLTNDPQVFPVTGKLTVYAAEMLHYFVLECFSRSGGIKKPAPGGAGSQYSP